MISQCPSVFDSKPGRTIVSEHSVFVGDTVSIHQSPYRIPYSRREAVKDELDKMLAGNIIRPSTSPWASPIVLVPKKDGEVRFCVDYRKVNQVAKFDAYPMPRVEEMFEKMGNASVVSTLDLAKGYWQIPMALDSREKTAFTTPFGLYELEVMPVGLHNGPASFQRTMNHALRGCQNFAQAYLDDIIVFSSSWQEHIQHLWEVLVQLQKADLKVKLKKCRFVQTHTRYLGHVIGGGEMRPDPEKVQPIGITPSQRLRRMYAPFLD